jgi:type II secretory pathway component PulJ
MNVAIRRRLGRLLLVVLIGLMLGALLTELAVRFMPDSAARERLRAR